MHCQRSYFITIEKCWRRVDYCVFLSCWMRGPLIEMREMWDKMILHLVKFHAPSSEKFHIPPRYSQYFSQGFVILDWEWFPSFETYELILAFGRAGKASPACRIRSLTVEETLWWLVSLTWKSYGEKCLPGNHKFKLITFFFIIIVPWH